MKMNSNLEQQIDELEFLQSMFSAPGEFRMDDVFYKQAVDYVTPGHHAYGVPKQLSCCLNIPISAHQDSDDEEAAEEASAASNPLHYNVDISIQVPNR